MGLRVRFARSQILSARALLANPGAGGTSAAEAIAPMIIVDSQSTIAAREIASVLKRRNSRAKERVRSFPTQHPCMHDLAGPSMHKDAPTTLNRTISTMMEYLIRALNSIRAKVELFLTEWGLTTEVARALPTRPLPPGQHRWRVRTGANGESVKNAARPMSACSPRLRAGADRPQLKSEDPPAITSWHRD